MNPGIFEKRDSFLSLAFLPHVNGISGILTVPRVDFFKNASLSFSCERTKTKNFEYDDTIHCTTHAQSGMADKNLKGKLNTQFRKLSDSLIAFTLTLNIQKSNFILFHPHQKRATHPSKYIYLIVRKAAMHLGVLLDRHLSWKFRINTIGNKLIKLLA